MIKSNQGAFLNKAKHLFFLLYFLLGVYSFGLSQSSTIVINEVDYDQPSTDGSEFVELKNVSGSGINLSAFTLELVNGNAGGATVYQTISLPNVVLAPGDYFVVCGNSSTVANCDLVVAPATNLIQNGSPDAIGLKNSGTLIDAVSYEGNSGAPYTEGSGTGLEDPGGAADVSLGISRFPDGTDTDINNADFSLRCITPGLPNVSNASNCLACSINSLTLSNISVCNDQGTGDPNDDTFTADITVTFLNAPLSGTLDISGDASASVGVGSLVGGSNTFTNVLFQADGTTIILTASFSANTSCTFTNNSAGNAPVPCSPCAIVSDGLTGIQCHDNGTTNDPTDDFITFSINPTGFNLGSGYTVSVNMGNISPASASYGSATVFTLQNGSAGNGHVNLTIQDNASSTCLLVVPVTDPGSCSNDCQLVDSGLSNITCNDGGTISDPTDDFITFSLNPTGFNLGVSYTVVVNTGLVSPGSANYGSSSVFTLPTGSAGSGNVDLTISDNTYNNCSIADILQDPGSCSPICQINSITWSNVTSCNDNGTPGAGDDFFTADIIVNYFNAPNAGFLNLSGSATESVAVGSIGITSHTFISVQIPANGQAIVITANFSENTGCSLTESSFGTAPNQCSCLADAGDLLPVGPVEICEGESTPEFTADYSAVDEFDPNNTIPTGISLSEFRIDQPGANDDDEYFEIAGIPGTDLSNLTLIVLGDGTGGSGVVEDVLNLNGQTIPADGYFLGAMSTFTLGTPDFVTNLNFENSDNVTFLLVQGFSGALGNDLDTNDDGVLDLMPWATIIDAVALILQANPPTTTEFEYASGLGFPTVGPDGSFVPGHARLVNGVWTIGIFDTADPNATDTPGMANVAPNYAYIWIVTQDNSSTGGTTSDIITVQAGANSAPYGTVFNSLTPGSYCVHGLSFNGLFADFQVLGYTSVQDIFDDIQNGLICADLNPMECIPLTVTENLAVTDVVVSDCSGMTTSSFYQVSFSISGGDAPVTINGIAISGPFPQMIPEGTITGGTGTDNDPWLFISNPIQSNSIANPVSYSFTVSDASPCPDPLTIEGFQDCDPCDGFEEPNPIADITVCQGTPIIISPTGGGKTITTQPSELFISEYIEGSSNNKCIEIFNRTGTNVNLATGNYQLLLYFNGSVTPGQTINLIGTVPNDDVFVICHSQAGANFLALSDQTSGGLQFNGDDAVALVKNGSIIDVIGQIGFDPGTMWGTGLSSTMDNTIIRKPAVYQGDINGNDAFDPSLEWDGFPNDYDLDLGQHVFSGSNPLPVTYNFYKNGGPGVGVLLGSGLTYTVQVPTDVPADGLPHPIFVTANSTAPNCESEAIQLDVTVLPSPAATNAVLFECDLDGQGALITNFNLSDANSLVTLTPNVSITYHSSLADALNGVNPLSSSFSVTNTVIIYARVENNTNGCAATAQVTLTVVECPIEITDPCSCRDNPNTPAVSGNATTFQNGQFDEEISINAPSGQTWYIQLIDGLFRSSSPHPPAAPLPFTTGINGHLLTEIVRGNGRSDYVLEGIHVDSIGYTVTLLNRNGVPRQIQRTICYYPTLQLEGISDEPLCLYSPDIQLVGTEVNGADGTASIRVLKTGTGLIASTIGTTLTLDPNALGTGFFTVEFTFDALNPVANNLGDPGCQQTLTRTFRIQETPSNLACNNLVQVSLDENCSAAVHPDMILEGNYTCYDDYKVDLYIGLRPLNTSPVVTGANIGQLVTARVTHLPSGNSCWGTLTAEDKFKPQLICPTAPVSLTCLEDPDDVLPPVAIDNCDPNPVVFLVQETIQEDDACAIKTVTRIFRAVDRYGNESAPCTQVIQVSKTVPVEFPEDITWTCEQYAAFPNVIQANSLHPCLIDPTLDAEDDVLNVAAFFSYTDGEDFDVPLLPDYDDHLDNPLTDPNPNVLDDPDTPQANDPIYSTLGTISPETDNFNGLIQPLVCNLSTSVNPKFLFYIDNRPHIPDTIRIPNYNANAIRGLEDADVLALTGSGIPNVKDSDCPYVVYYDDRKLEACDGVDTSRVFKILRTWYVLNWCTGELLSDIQIIKVIDKVAPKITFPASFDVVLDANQSSNGHQSCASNGILDVPLTNDNCAGVGEIRAFTPVGEGVPIFTSGARITGFRIPAPYLPIGQHIITYQVTDKCGNIATASILVRVEDNIPPVPVCRELTKVSLSSFDATAMAAPLFDEGSYDNCGQVFFKVLKMTPNTCNRANINKQNEIAANQEWFDDEVLFCCNDIQFDAQGNPIPVEIILRVYDVDPGPGAIRTTRQPNSPNNLLHNSFLDQNHYNDCMIRVTVEDKMRPVCIPPDDVWTTCSDIPANVNLNDTLQLQSLFGQASSADNCQSWIQELTPSVSVDICGVGTVIRTFRARDNHGNTSVNLCRQRIQIMSNTNYELDIPGDFEDECSTAHPDMLLYVEKGCDLLAVNIEERIFYASGDGSCKKIIRTYRIINWCEYDGFSDPTIIPRQDLNRDGVYGDGFTPGNPRSRYRANYRLISNGDYVYLNIVNDPVTRFLPSTGYYQYDQHVKIFDDQAPLLRDTSSGVFCGGDRDEDPCTGPINLGPVIDENCTPDDLTVTWQLDINRDGIFDTNGSNSLTGRFPLGRHLVRYRVSDDCGNTSQLDIPFEIIDCKAPTPVCFNGLSINLMPSGMVELWAIDFDASSFDYCHPLKLRINRIEDLNGDGFITSDDYRTTPPAFDSVQFRCRDKGTRFVQLWVGEVSNDNVNNWDFCVTLIEIQDNNNACGAGTKPALVGKIRTEMGIPVKQVNVDLSGHMSQSAVTSNTGEFEFLDLAAGEDYSVSPHRNDNFTNGVTTFDLVIISKHILRVDTIDSPYKLIAADANRSNSISTLDVVALRKLILRVANDLPGNTSWRFVDKQFEFPDPANPWLTTFPEAVSFNNLDLSVLDADFVGIKIGDVNNSAKPNDFATIEQRSLFGQLSFVTPDLLVFEGDEFEVPLTTKSLDDFSGYQHTIQFDPEHLELLAIENEITGPENFGLSMAEQGIINVSWNGDGKYGERHVLLKFRSKANLQLSDYLTINSASVQAEAYSKKGELWDVDLVFSKSAISIENGTFALHQNVPNPFTESTVIEFDLPADETVKLTISELNGRTVKVLKGHFLEGRNRIEMKKSDFPSSGIFQYQLETTTDSATKKLILMK